ncbi:hypothetical protein VP01_2435g1 [Puccinia sorghi]|uniref:Uncharacterized protein n=1 Tax=Puccinia sorghi TaxID=27349 RepID=A0A0L6V861_9BASI|nr:hypothetical protein VP01_2435g1 [Puccinia sorghi]
MNLVSQIKPWVHVVATKGFLDYAEIDTNYFIGNFPQMVDLYATDSDQVRLFLSFLIKFWHFKKNLETMQISLSIFFFRSFPPNPNNNKNFCHPFPSLFLLGSQKSTANWSRSMTLFVNWIRLNNYLLSMRLIILLYYVGGRMSLKSDFDINLQRTLLNNIPQQSSSSNLQALSLYSHFFLSSLSPPCIIVSFFHFFTIHKFLTHTSCFSTLTKCSRTSSVLSLVETQSHPALVCHASHSQLRHISLSTYFFSSILQHKSQDTISQFNEQMNWYLAYQYLA